MPELPEEHSAFFSGVGAFDNPGAVHIFSEFWRREETLLSSEESLSSEMETEKQGRKQKWAP
jgi:hypothetical protein